MASIPTDRIFYGHPAPYIHNVNVRFIIYNFVYSINFDFWLNPRHLTSGLNIGRENVYADNGVNMLTFLDLW